jgi:putative phosphoesterase
MKIAVLSDIHSNHFAMAAVADALGRESVDSVILLGDVFGYYPWAVETYHIIRRLEVIAVLGNHDQLVLAEHAPDPVPSYWDVAKHNENALAAESPEALDWLGKLPISRELLVGERRILCCHGTPDAPLTGRFYPDNVAPPEWASDIRECILMGHTHHPIVRRTEHRGLIANPGSVGQPRDGDSRASWGILYPDESRFELKRTEYDVTLAIRLLEEQSWYSVAIDSLRKNHRRYSKTHG